MSFEPVEDAIEAAIAEGVFPGAVLLVRQGEQFSYLRAFGRRCLVPACAPMEEDTIFDLASLTKPLATTIALMFLVQEGKLRLDDRVSRYFPNFSVHGKSSITFRHLLSHRSGLPAWRPYYQEVLREQKAGRVNLLASPEAKSFVYQRIFREQLEVEPDREAIYSDVGFMLLGAVVEQIAGVSLDRVCNEKIFKPLGLRRTGFVDLSLLRARRLEPVTQMIAATEYCPWRQKVLCGEVHDDNAYAMGGVAGHAGLFSCAREIDVLLSALQDAYRRVGGFVAQRIVREFWTRDGRIPDSTWCLGWDTPTPGGSAAGRYFSANAVGHLGFTGCSIWIDLDRKLHVILLTNRVHPSRENEKIRAFRPLVHDLIGEALG